MNHFEPHVEMIQIKLTKSVFAVNPDHQPTEERIAIGVTLRNHGVFSENDRRQASFVQTFKTAEPNQAPFFLDVEFETIFLVDPAPLPLERPHYIRQVFPRVVFPYLREYIAETTRRGGFTPLIVSQNLFEDEDLRPVEVKDDTKWVH